MDILALNFACMLSEAWRVLIDAHVSWGITRNLVNLVERLNSYMGEDESNIVRVIMAEAAVFILACACVCVHACVRACVCV